MGTSPGPLTPYRVLDLTDGCGQLGPRLFADLGADVIRIEPPEGNPARRDGPYYHDDPRPDRSLSWFYFNANKRGVTLNLRTEDGRALLRRLAAQADVLFESCPPAEREALGLSYEALSAANPSLIIVSVTPFGSTGPYAGYKGSDIVTWAMGGHMSLDGDADRPPVRVSVPQAYSHAGAHAAVGAMIALYERGDSDRGQHVDVSAQEAVAWALMNAALVWDVSRVNVPRGGAIRVTPRPPLPPRRYQLVWPCKDGYVNLALGGGQGGAVDSMRALVAYMDREGMAEGLAAYNWEDFNLREVDQEELDRVAAVFARFLLTRTKEELAEEAVRSGIRLAPLHTVDDLLNSRQLRARDYWQHLDHPELGEAIIYPGATVKLSDTPWSLRRRAPLLGEHNTEVYGEIGLSGDDLRALREAGAL